MTPMIGAHSVIERPLPVRRVAAPTIAVNAIMVAISASQPRRMVVLWSRGKGTGSMLGGATTIWTMARL